MPARSRASAPVEIKAENQSPKVETVNARRQRRRHR